MADLEAAFGDCEARVRAGDKDRWLAGLFARAELRRDLFALYAFSLEVAGVRERVSQPLPGEIRLQWWRDALEGEARGDAAAHPVAAALLDVIVRRGLPRAPLVDLIEARVFDLYDDLFPTANDLVGYCGETTSALMQLAAMVLAEGADPGTAELAGHAGVALALTGLLRAFPAHAARGQVFVPADMLAEARASREAIVARRDPAAAGRALALMRGLARGRLERALALLPAAGRTAPAFLPLAAARLYLDRMDRLIAAPFTTLVEVPQWRRQWAMWRAARRIG